ncbi:MAG: hypothetical protein ACSHWY_06680 [Octadecabacter sp.]
MSQSNLIAIVMVVLFGGPDRAFAFSCAPSAMVEAGASEAEVDRAIVEHLYERLTVDHYEWRKRQGEESDQIIVYGQFERTNDVPLPHIIEGEQRRLRWEESGEDERDFVFGIEYNYANAYRFDGVQIIDGAEVPFQTEKTWITINTAGEMQDGVTPPTGVHVVGPMWENSGGWFLISSAPCGEYDQIAPARYDMLLGCLADGVCG